MYEYLDKIRKTREEDIRGNNSYDRYLITLDLLYLTYTSSMSEFFAVRVVIISY